MPELPEVETIAAGIHARVQGRRITRVWTSGKPQTFKSPEPEIAAPSPERASNPSAESARPS